MKNFKHILLTIIALLLFVASIKATPLTIAAQDIPNFQAGGATCSLKLYASDAFTDSSGVRYLGGAVGSANFFQKIVGTVTGTVCTIPSFTTQSTTDAIANNTVRITAAVYDSKDVKRATYLDSFTIPTSLGTSITWAQITVYNRTAARPPTPNFYDSADQINAQIQQQISNVTLSGATTSAKGTVKVSVAGDTVVSTTDPLVAAQVNTRYANSYASLAAAQTAIGTTSKTKLVVSTTLNVATTTTLSANINVQLEAGGAINVASGQTLTISKLDDPGNRQVFGGAGNVILGRQAVPRFNVWWWIAPDTGADATKGIDNALASAAANSGGSVFFPAGTWITQGNHILPDNTEISGIGTLGTVIAASVNNVDVFKVQSLPNFYLKNLRVRNLTLDANGKTGINLVKLTGITPNSLYYLIFEEVRFLGGETSVKYIKSGGLSFDIEYLTFTRCQFVNPTLNAFYIDSADSFVRFDECLFNVLAGKKTVNIVQAGTILFNQPNVFGVGSGTPNVPATDGSVFIYLAGGCNDLIVNAGQDEGMHYYLRTSTNAYPQGNIHFNDTLVQSLVKFDGNRTLYSDNCQYFPNTFLDASGVFSTVYSSGDTLLPATVGATITDADKLENFTGLSYVAREDRPGGFVSQRRQYYDFEPALYGATEVLPTPFSDNFRSRVAIIGDSSGHPLLALVDRNGAQKYGYRISRDISSIPGWLTFEGNQAEPFKGYAFDAEMTVKGDTVARLTATQTLANKTISGAANTISNVPESSITNLTTDLAAKAPLASPTFAGTPLAPTASAGTNTTQLATTAFVQTQLATSILTGTASFDFPSTAAVGQTVLTVTVTGAIAGDACLVTPNGLAETGLIWNCSITATNTASVRISNITAGAIDPAARNYKITVFK